MNFTNGQKEEINRIVNVILTQRDVAFPDKEAFFALGIYYDMQRCYNGLYGDEYYDEAYRIISEIVSQMEDNEELALSIIAAPFLQRLKNLVSSI